MGGRGASSGNRAKTAGAEGLDNAIRAAQNEFDRLNRKLETIAENNPLADMPDSYYETKRAQEKAREKLNRLQDERAKRREKTTANGRRPNGYGEMTSRNITTQTYENSIRRTRRNVNDWFGRGMDRR